MAEQRRQAVYTYAGWEINIPRLELRSRGALVPLGGRAFQVLAILVQSSGEVVEKYDLIDRVWPNISVEENTLRLQIHAIRKALGDDRALLGTVSGRGYCLRGSWSIQESTDESVLTVERGSSGGDVRTNLPIAASVLIGRAEAKQRLLDAISAYRVLTLTGPGGIGKSVLGLELAHSLLPGFEGDCWFVPLVSLSDPALVASAVASVLGLRIGGHELTAEAVARSIAGGKVLLVLDNCEHVIDGAAALVEAIQRTCPQAIVLATSREILRVTGEYVYRVPPLDVPPQHMEVAEDFQEYSSVQLLIDRLKSFDNGFLPSPHHLPAMVAICRRLDGIPLAIEFAAARVATLGFEQVVALLNDRFNLLTVGRRTALPQHQTLRATLGWSYDLLSIPEQTLLRRLAIFADGFTLEAATAVMRDVTETVSEVAEEIESLVTKSLVARDGSETSSRWRLLETIRAYASDKLIQNGEAQEVARCHSEYYRNLVVSGTCNSRTAVEVTAQYAREIGNIRAALDWCFSSTGDAQIGVSLTAAFCPVWLDISLLAECRERIERALQHLTAEMDIAPSLRMRLQITLGIVLIITFGAAERANRALTEGINLASGLEDLDAQIQASWALWALHFNGGEHRLAKSAADRFAGLATQARDASVLSVASRIVGYTLQYMGRQQEARLKLENAIDLSRRRDAGRRHPLPFLYDQQLLARASLSRSLWLQGFMDQADDLAQACLVEARQGNSKLNLCFVLGLAVCPVALVRGDMPGAQRFVAMLMEIATRQSFTQYVNVGRRLEAALMVERGEFAAASTQLRAVLDMREGAGWRLSHPEAAGILANGLAGQARPDEALTTVDWGLTNAEEGGVRWYIPELLRIKGEVLRRYKTREKFSASEECFREAIDVAKEQGALLWELRATLGLARAMMEQNQIADVHQVLSSVYGKFTEGFEATDLRNARMMLETCRPPARENRLRGVD